MLIPLALLAPTLVPQTVAPTTEPSALPRVTFVEKVMLLPGAPVSFATAPLDGGPVPDLALVTISQVGSSYSSRLWVLEGLGDGTFQDAYVTGLGTQYSNGHTMRVVDFDADGWNDVSVPGYLSNGGLRFGDGTLVYDDPLYVPTVGGDRADHAFADYTGDGLLDALSLVRDLGGYFVDTAENDGNGGFTNLQFTDVAPYDTFHAHLVTADFDGGGLESDCAVTSSFGIELVDYPAFSSPIFAQGGPYGQAESADVDGDGDADLFATRTDTKGLESLLNDGAGNLTAASFAPLGERAEHVSLADMDLDGDLDAVATASDSDTVRIVWNDGLGGLRAAAPFPVGNFPTLVSLSDLDLDGDVDAVVANVLDKTLSVLLSTRH